MPHYRDGTEARVGDIARGRGYNVHDYDVQGVVLKVTPGDACNLIIGIPMTTKLWAQVAVATEPSDLRYVSGLLSAAFEEQKEGMPASTYHQYRAQLGFEYGAVQDFELVHRPGVVS